MSTGIKKPMVLVIASLLMIMLAAPAGGKSGGAFSSSADADEIYRLDLVGTVSKAGSFKIVAAALKAARSFEALKGKGPFTVLVLAGEALARRQARTAQLLRGPERKDKTAAVLACQGGVGA